MRNDYNTHLDRERSDNLKQLKALVQQARALETRPEALYVAIRVKLSTAIVALDQAIKEYES